MRKLLKTVPVRILRCRAPALNEKSRPETGRHNKRKNAKTDKWLLSKYQNVSVAMSPNPIWSANEALLRTQRPVYRMAGRNGDVLRGSTRHPYPGHTSSMVLSSLCLRHLISVRTGLVRGNATTSGMQRRGDHNMCKKCQKIRRSVAFQVGSASIPIDGDPRS